MSIRTTLRSYWQHALAVSVLVGALVVPMVQVAAVSSAAQCPTTGGARDCNDNSIMYGGAYTKEEWLNNVKNGDPAGHKDLAAIYANDGINETNFMSADTVEGTVYKNGDVKLANGTLVASNSWSAGRHNVSGAVQSGSVYFTPENVQFLKDSIPAFINMSGGSFHYAVLKSCGNQVKSITQPFGQIYKRVTDVTKDPNTTYAADDNATAAEVATGDALKYLIRINNAGTGDMTNTVFTDDLPAGVELASNPAQRHIEYNFGTVKAGASVQAEVNVKTTSTTVGYIDNKACFTGSGNQSGCDHAIVKITKGTPTPTPTPSVTPTPTPTPSVTPTPTPTPTPSKTPTPTPTPSKTPTPTPTPSKTPTPTPTPSKTPTPTPTPSKTPTPTPTPSKTPTPTPTPTPSVTPTPTPTPSNLVCKELKATPKNGPDSLEYTFVVTPTGDKTLLKSYHFEVVAENGAKKTIDSPTGSIDFTFAQAGTYTVTGQLVTATETQAQVEACVVKLTVGPTNQTPQPTPPGETLGTSTELPATGPESALAGIGGLSALGYATRSYLRSRKSLVNTMKRK